MKIAYLGPAGTFTEDALGEALGDADFEPLRTDTVFEAILAVTEGRADRALAPYENSIEGSVRGTLDILAFDAPNVEHRRRARLSGAPAPDHPRGRRARAGRGGALPPAGAGADRAVPAREPAGGGTAERQQHRGGGADGLRVAAPLGGGRLARGGGPLRLPDPPRGDPGRAEQRHPLRLAGAGGDRAGLRREGGRPR